MKQNRLMWIFGIVVVIVLLFMFWLEYSYAHIILELLIISVSFTIVLLIWNTKTIVTNQSLVFIGLSLLVVVIFHLLHLLYVVNERDGLFITQPFDIYYQLATIYFAAIYAVGIVILKQDQKMKIKRLAIIQGSILLGLLILIEVFGLSFALYTESFDAGNMLYIIQGLVIVLLLAGMIKQLTVKEPKELCYKVHYLVIGGMLILSSLLQMIFFPYHNIVSLLTQFGSFGILYHITIKKGVVLPYKNVCREVEAQNEKLLELSRIDDLTLIANRRYLFENLDKTFRLGRREKHSVGFLMVDIDDFKMYNDTFGHLHGDSILKRVAKAIEKSCMRPLDFVGRFGGEEFLVVLPNSDYQAAEILCKRILQAIHDLRIAHYQRENEFLTVSIGFSVLSPTADHEINYPIQKADEQLYKVKATGKKDYRGINLDEKKENENE